MNASSSEESVPSVPVVEKFGLLKDLGTIIVPNEYVHATRLRQYRQTFNTRQYQIDPNITDHHFSSPTVELIPGRRLHIIVFQQISFSTTTFKERLAFLQRRNALLTGAQGAALVLTERSERLPKEIWKITSFDCRQALWRDAQGTCWAPSIQVSRKEGTRFFLSNAHSSWWEDDAFFGFFDADQLVMS